MALRFPDVGFTFVPIIVFLSIEVFFLPRTYRTLAEAVLSSDRKPASEPCNSEWTPATNHLGRYEAGNGVAFSEVLKFFGPVEPHRRAGAGAQHHLPVSVPCFDNIAISLQSH